MSDATRLQTENTPREVIHLAIPLVQSMVDSIGFYLGVLDLDGRHLITNGVSLDSAGLEPASVLGVRIEDTYWWNFSEESKSRIRSEFLAAKGGETIRTQAIGRVAPDTFVHVEYTLAPLRQPGTDRIIGVTFSGTDIDRIVQAETTAVEAAIRIRLLIESNPIGVASGDLDGTVRECNQAFLDLLGVTREEVHRGEVNWIGRTPADQRDIARERFAEGIAQGKCGPFEKEFLRPDGTRVTALVGAALVAGSPPSGTAFVLDLTERKVAEDRLRQSEARFRLLAELLPHLVWTTDQEGTVNFMNSQWQAYTGLTSEQILNLPRGEIVHPDDRFRVKQAWDETRANRKTYEDEFRLRRHDGAYRWFLVRGSFETDLDGSARWIGTCTDINDQKEQQETARINEQRFRGLVEAMPGFAWTASPQGVVTWVPPSFAAFTGHIIDETINLVLSHPDEVASISAKWQHSIKTGEPYHNEQRIRDRDGNFRWFLVRAVPISDTEGNVTQWVGVSTDIHFKKTYESELELAVAARTLELTAINEEMESFTYSISHDLRAPLRAIAANAAMLAEHAHPGLDREALHMIDRLGANSKKLGVLIDELLSLTRIGREAMEKSPVDLSVLILDIVEDLEASRDARWSFVIEPDLHTVGDARFLRLALTNLIENAVKFSPSGGEIYAGKTGRAFFVRDQGIGFDDRFAERIFRPFERLVGEKDFPGTGIGLTNVQRIIERHGGTVWAKSRPGEGTTIYFSIP